MFSEFLQVIHNEDVVQIIKKWVTIDSRDNEDSIVHKTIFIKFYKSEHMDKWTRTAFNTARKSDKTGY